jgi:hypothetical protein
MKFSRRWAMPNKNTFSIKPIAELIGRHIGPAERWIDPFARNSPFNSQCVFTNDLAPEANTTHHMEALDFLNSLEGEFDGCLFDPPYSPRQISECYKSVGRDVHMKDTQSSFYGDRKKAVARLIKHGGIVISCGWNSGGIGKTLGFEIEEILLVPHGGAHNDTIVTVERKVLTPL